MPRNFPEIWDARVRQTLESGAVADFLDGVAELPGEISEMGEENVIHIPATSFTPNVLINNTTYPIALQDYDDETIIVKLDKYITEATKVTDDQIIGSSYPLIDAVTKAHTNQILVTKYGKALHAIPPASNTAETPVLVLAGDKCTYEDLVAFKRKCDAAKWPLVGRRLVLAPDHYNDLLLDRERFGNVINNINKGEVANLIAGFEIKQYVQPPMYKADGTKAAFGEVPETTDKVASVAFVVSNMAKKTGLTKQYFSDAKTSPTTQANLLNYRHYFIAVPVEKKYIGALISK